MKKKVQLIKVYLVSVINVLKEFSTVLFLDTIKMHFNIIKNIFWTNAELKLYLILSIF